MSIKVSITDDHPVVAEGITKLIQNATGMELVACYTNGQSLLRDIEANQPDVLILDMQLPDSNGPDIARTILKSHPHIAIVVLSSFDVLIQVKKMLQLGCKGYLLKDADGDLILDTIRKVHQGEQVISPSLEKRLLNDMLKNKSQAKEGATLSKREKEVLQLIVDEFTNQEIADKLFVSPHTVEFHRMSLLHKLKVKNTAGLVKKAIENGLVK